MLIILVSVIVGGGTISPAQKFECVQDTLLIGIIPVQLQESTPFFQLLTAGIFNNCSTIYSLLSPFPIEKMAPKTTLSAIIN